MKRFLSLILALIFCFSLASCALSPTSDNDADTVPPQSGDENDDKENEDKNEELPPEIVDKVYTVSHETRHFKMHGRTSVLGDDLVCDTSASGIEFNAYVEGDLNLTVNVNKLCYFTLYIDGVRQEERIKVDPGTHTLTLASFNDQKVHTVKFLKQTEAQCALSTIKTLDFKGYFMDPPADKEFLIEVIGDSITVGFGNLCANGTANSGSAPYQDATQTYGFLAAEALGADVSLVCYSGIGVGKGWPSFTMDSYFAADSYVRNTATKFEPTRVPDVVVINLGTNDSSRGATFKDLAEKVPALIKLVRKTYGEDMPIVWVNGMMGEAMWTYINIIINQNFGGEKGGIYHLNIPANHEGGGGHPSLAAQISAGDLLAKYIEEKELLK